MSEPITIEVWSDVVCPWCYIGKRRLETALGDVGSGDVEVIWRAFQLDPNSPRPGEPGHGQGMAEHLGQKYGGGIEAGQQMNEQMTKVAAGEGLDFHLDLVGTGNTTDAHRLLHLAAEESTNLQDALKERFFAAFFTQGLDTSSPEVLSKLAIEVGLNADRVAEVLASDEFSTEVRTEMAQAQAYGANGVPFTVVNGTYGISGAQPASVFAEAIQRARADQAPQLTAVQGDADASACGPDGCAVPEAQDGTSN